MKRVIAIVQARMGSRRLPGKSMLNLGQWPILEWVLRRLLIARRLDGIVLATSKQEEDRVLCDVAEHLGVGWFRGSEHDVLQRYAQAAEQWDAEVVVRVCADCPLVDPTEVDRIVSRHIESRADYSFNHIPALGNNYPDGLGAEVIGRKCLDDLDTTARRPSQREHVSAYIWAHPDDFRIETIQAASRIAGPDIKLDVDTAADLEKLEKLFADWNNEPEAWHAADIVATYRRMFGKPVVKSNQATGDTRKRRSSRIKPNR